MIPYSNKQVYFYSRFECGNLLRAVKKNNPRQESSFTGMSTKGSILFEYDLYLEPDVKTESHMHWYNFLCISENLKKGDKIRLNIRNLVRSKSLYQEGMLPRICFKNHDINLGWHVNPNVTQEVKFS